MTNPTRPFGRSARFAALVAMICCIALLTVSQSLSAFRNNGFDLAGALIPEDEIHHGGPPRDGIPAIDEPRFERATAANFLSDDDRVLGVALDGVSRAYPIRILNYHEIVNDTFAGRAIVVTYCPLCGTGVAFSAEVNGKERRFGVSGLLYNSDVLLYDRDTESLWSQLMSRAVAGPLKGTQLTRIPVAHTTWSDWRRRHPDTLVLSAETGYRRDYTRSPYGGYESSKSIYFPVANSRRDYHPKELVIGLELDGATKVYPFAELSRTPETLIDRLANKTVTIEFDAHNRTGRVLEENGKEIPSIIAYWFAWIAFHPDTEVYRAPR